MKLNKKEIINLVGQSDFEKGLEYLNKGRVAFFTESEKNGIIYIEAIVKGKSVYNTRIQCDLSHIKTSCNCIQHAYTGSCKHIAATALASLDYSHTSEAKDLISQYVNRSTAINSATMRKAHITPYISDVRQNEYPSFSFKVGYDRTYVIKDIHEFLKNFTSGKVKTYGKNLTLKHSLSEFDDFSVKIILILIDSFNDLKTYNNPYRSYYDYGYNSKDTVRLMGISFDKFFSVLEGSSVFFRSGNDFVICAEENPEPSIRLKKDISGARLIFDDVDNINFFGNMSVLYYMDSNRMLKCSDDFHYNMKPLLDSMASGLDISNELIPDFASCVLPEIQPYVNFSDDDNILEKYEPDECTPCFYFDSYDDVLTARLKFRYNNSEYEDDTELPKNIIRDARTEITARQALQQFFAKDEEIKNNIIIGDENIYDFLSVSLQEFYKLGDVFVSDRLSKKQIKSTSSSIGVSVSDGLLSLDFDTGEFPTEELESLYHSLLLKRKYHKLKDGRFLALDGSSYEKLAEMTHMMQISPKEIADGHVTVPAYRSLYLDSVLRNSENLTVERDSTFKAMVRGFKTVSDSDYAVPNGFQKVLRSYQKTGYRWLKTLESCHFGGILADEMGLGKTLQIIAYFSSVYPNENKPSLVVCPASLLLNWSDEIARFNPKLSYSAVLGSAEERRSILSQDHSGKVLITSYDLLKRDIDIYEKISFYCCVIDEGQYIKNRTTLASKALKKIVCEQRFVLTGTPIENRLSELWNLFDFLMPGYLFSHGTFVDRLEKPIVKNGDSEAHEQLSKLVKPFILRRLKSDVLKELPPKVEYIQKIRLSEKERKVYLSAVNAAKGTSFSGKLEILAALTRLRQICCDPSLCYENYEGETSKLDACIELCKSSVENGHQILVFSQFTSMLDRIRERLDKESITSYTIQGSTGKEKRASLVKSFNKGGASVFLISLKAGGTGLNLTAADVVIHYDPWWNIAAQNQATDRAHRIGQKSSVSIYKLIAKDTIEEKIQLLQERKAALMDVISDNADGDVMSMSKEDLLALLDL